MVEQRELLQDDVCVSLLFTAGSWDNMDCFVLVFFPQTYVFTDGEDEKLRKRLGELQTYTGTD